MCSFYLATKVRSHCPEELSWISYGLRALLNFLLSAHTHFKASLLDAFAFPSAMIWNNKGIEDTGRDGSSFCPLFLLLPLFLFLLSIPKGLVRF